MKEQAATVSPPSGRQGVAWRVLVQALETLESRTVLDCGGGSGSFAVPLAAFGAKLTVVDISADALAILTRRAAEAGVADRVTPVQGDVEALADAVGEQLFDLVLAHGILGSVDDVAATFAAIAATVRPGGLLSLLVTNPAAGVLSRALAGDLPAALAELRAIDAGLTEPGPEAVRALCAGHGLLIEQVHGVGIFSELVPGRALDTPGARDALAELESSSATRSPFAEIAGRVHLLARRSSLS
ncbi:MAG TPA: methyltransferase domain-containing protein [Jatrophihabitans sp.]|jgi:SAM-dependent methyltransferase